MLAIKIILALMSAIVIYLAIDHYIVMKDINHKFDLIEKSFMAQGKLNDTTRDLLIDIIYKIREKGEKDNERK